MSVGAQALLRLAAALGVVAIEAMDKMLKTGWRRSAAVGRTDVNSRLGDSTARRHNVGNVSLRHSFPDEFESVTQQCRVTQIPYGAVLLVKKPVVLRVSPVFHHNPSDC